MSSFDPGTGGRVGGGLHMSICSTWCVYVCVCVHMRTRMQECVCVCVCVSKCIQGTESHQLFEKREFNIKNC